jgi:hypothetical protein
MRIARWGAAAGAVALVSLPIAAQAEILPSPQIDTSSVVSKVSSVPARITGTVLHRTVTNLKTNVSHAVPTASGVHSSGLHTNLAGLAGHRLNGHSFRGSGFRSSSVRTASTRHASAVHAADNTQTVVIPAPTSTAQAYAANILDAIAISHTIASAGNGTTQGTANVIEIGGNPLLPQLGGTQKGVGNSSGVLLDTAAIGIPTNALQLQIAPWSVTNTQSSSASSSKSIADLLVLTLGDTSTSSSASLRVLQSTSNANWTQGQSTSNGTSDGAILNVGGSGGLNVDILHSDTSSTTPGTAYILSINGNPIGSSSQAGGQCALTIPSLLSLSCLTATGGLAGTVASGATQVLGVQVTPLGTGANLFTTNANSGSGGITLPGIGSGNGGQTGNNGVHPATVHAAAKAGHHRLAFTGTDVPVLIGIAVLLLSCGTGLVWLVRRPRTVGLA